MDESSRRLWVQSKLCMGTVVTIRVSTSCSSLEVQKRIKEAFEIFQTVERICSRFDPDSELVNLCRTPHSFVPVSEILYQTMQFALAVAERTQGLFDPTVGHRLASLGFNRHYLTNEINQSLGVDEIEVNYRDIKLDEEHRAILLKKPLMLDLGAVAKGFAVDLAAKTLQMFEGYVIDAGGDLFVAGTNEQELPWTVGIQDPFHKDSIICKLEVTDMAICTSGHYERKSPVREGVHHIIYPSTEQSPSEIVSCTVLAPFAMLADAFSTVGLLHDASSAKMLMESENLPALFVTADKAMRWTTLMEGFLNGETQ